MVGSQAFFLQIYFYFHFVEVGGVGWGGGEWGQMPAEGRRASQLLTPGVTGGCKQLNMDARNQTRVFWKNTKSS